MKKIVSRNFCKYLLNIFAFLIFTTYATYASKKKITISLYYYMLLLCFLILNYFKNLIIIKYKIFGNILVKKKMSTQLDKVI